MLDEKDLQMIAEVVRKATMPLADHSNRLEVQGNRLETQCNKLEKKVTEVQLTLENEQGM